MAKKVTVSIPDLLHEKMEKWRRSFNLSKMLQDAIAEAIQRKEDFQKRIQEDLNLSEIVDRLKREKEHSEGNFFETGRHDGLALAKTAHYDDIQYALGWEDLENAARDSVLGVYFTGKLEKIQGKEKCRDGADGYAGVYLAGWKKGLCEFWDEVKHKL